MDKKTPFSAKHVCIMLAIAVFVAVVMTVLSGVPPLSGLYNWLAEHDMEAVWVGLTAGVIGECLSLYNAKRKRDKRF